MQKGKKKHGFGGKLGIGGRSSQQEISELLRGLKEPREKIKQNSWVEIKPCLHKAEEEISLDTEGKTN